MPNFSTPLKLSLTRKKGLFKITPKELGKLALDVIVEIDGIEMTYGRSVFYVVYPETTIAEIFKMNKD